MQYFGHEAIVRSVREADARLNIFVGPESVGKKSLALYFRTEWGVLDPDLLTVNRLTADTARMIEQFAMVAPIGHRRLVVARTLGASRIAYNVLLKTLEEAPETTRFFLIVHDDMVPATVLSRGHVYNFPPLDDDALADVLVHIKKFAPENARERAGVARGQIKTALTLPDIKERKDLVLRVLEAFRTKDSSILEDIAPRWTEEHTELLAVWCQEAVTKRWRFFLEEESGIPGTALPLKILIALRAEIKPRLVVRASLMSVLQGEK